MSGKKKDNEDFWRIFYPLTVYKDTKSLNRINPEINLAKLSTNIVQKIYDICQLSAQGKLLGNRNKTTGMITNTPAREIGSYFKFSWLSGLEDEQRILVDQNRTHV